MATYLERYRNGEHNQVWAELLALGGQVREQPLYDDALAVAQETMSRARANIETLVPRLKSLGYQFANPDRAFVPADGETRRLITEVEARTGPLPLSLRIWCEVVGEVNFMGSHPKLSRYAQMPGANALGQGFLSLFEKHGGVSNTTGAPALQGFELTKRLLGEVIEGIRSGKPRSQDIKAGVLASKEIMEQLQRPVVVPGPDVESDPLVVEPYFGNIEDNFYGGENDEDADDSHSEDDGTYEAIIAPDSIRKMNYSGGDPYSIGFPNAAIDGTLWADVNYGTFVEYLRICFRWGGYPGLRTSTNPPLEELAFLTKGLLPV
jgi:hypothetical protein